MSWAGYDVTPGNRVNPRERGYRRITPSSEEVRFLQLVFCCTQKRWWFTSDSGLVSLESHAPSEQIKQNRSKGCILSQADRQETQEVPQVCFRGQSLPILCSPIWTGTGPPNIYKVYGRSSCPVVALRHPHFELLGPLANISSIPRSGTETLRLSARSSTDPGTMNEPTHERVFCCLASEQHFWG